MREKIFEMLRTGDYGSILYILSELGGMTSTHLEISTKIDQGILRSRLNRLVWSGIILSETHEANRMSCIKPSLLNEVKACLEVYQKENGFRYTLKDQKQSSRWDHLKIKGKAGSGTFR